jgi:hypothetical protein
LATALSKLQADGQNAEALAKLDQLHALRDDLLEQLKKVVPENR